MGVEEGTRGRGRSRSRGKGGGLVTNAPVVKGKGRRNCGVSGE